REVARGVGVSGPGGARGPVEHGHRLVPWRGLRGRAGIGWDAPDDAERRVRVLLAVWLTGGEQIGLHQLRDEARERGLGVEDDRLARFARKKLELARETLGQDADLTGAGTNGHLCPGAVEISGGGAFSEQRPSTAGTASRVRTQAEDLDSAVRS